MGILVHTSWEFLSPSPPKSLTLLCILITKVELPMLFLPALLLHFTCIQQPMCGLYNQIWARNFNFDFWKPSVGFTCLLLTLFPLADGTKMLILPRIAGLLHFTRSILCRKTQINFLYCSGFKGFLSLQIQRNQTRKTIWEYDEV